MKKHTTYLQIIGKRIIVMSKGFKKLEGVVVDETAHTIAVETGKDIKKIAKKDITFTLPPQTIIHEGNDIIKMPHERLKMRT